MLAPAPLAVVRDPTDVAVALEVCQAELEESVRSLGYTLNDFAGCGLDLSLYERLKKEHEVFLDRFGRECARQGKRLRRNPLGCRSFADWLRVRLCLLRVDADGARWECLHIHRRLIEGLSHASAKAEGALALLLRQHCSYLMKEIDKEEWLLSAKQKGRFV